MEGRKVYNILGLSRLERKDLEKVAREFGVDTLNKTRQTVMYQILEEQLRLTRKDHDNGL